MSTSIMTSTDISQHHLHLGMQLKIFFDKILKSVGTDTAIKTLQFTLTIFGNNLEEKTWQKCVLKTQLMHHRKIDLILPSDDKKIIKLLRIFAETENSLSIFQSSFPTVTLRAYDSAQTSGERTRLLKKYREQNAEYAKGEHFTKFKNRAMEAIFLTFNSITSERFASEINCTVTVLNKKNPTIKHDIVVSHDLTQKCSTCEGLRTTAMAINACSECLQRIPENVPTFVNDQERRAEDEAANFDLAYASLKVLYQT